METAVIPAKPKSVTAKAALVGIAPEIAGVLRDCFRQFGIATVLLERDEQHRLYREKFQACVVPLDADAGKFMEAARNSASNSRIVIYGVAAKPAEALGWERYGINAVFHAPVERQGALRVVRSTYLLVLHELRRYVRLPMVTPVSIETPRGSLTAASAEISGEGMSLQIKGSEMKGLETTGLELMDTVTLTFDLPQRPGIVVRSRVCWIRRHERMAGVRFDAGDDRRLRVKEWIEDYLEF